MSSARVIVPAKVAKGQAFEIKAIIAHPMETGFRKDAVGNAIPRNIIVRFAARYDGEEVFVWELFSGVAANPFISFTTVATRTGELELIWTGIQNFRHVERRMITVV